MNWGRMSCNECSIVFNTGCDIWTPHWSTSCKSLWSLVSLTFDMDGLNWNKCCVFSTQDPTFIYIIYHTYWGNFNSFVFNISTSILQFKLNELICNVCCIVFNTGCEIKTPHWSCSPTSYTGETLVLTEELHQLDVSSSLTIQRPD